MPSFPPGVEEHALVGNSILSSSGFALSLAEAGARACSPDPAFPFLLQLEHCPLAGRCASEARAAALATAPLLV